MGDSQRFKRYKLGFFSGGMKKKMKVPKIDNAIRNKGLLQSEQLFNINTGKTPGKN